jgi:hypothetical protein
MYHGTGRSLNLSTIFIVPYRYQPTGGISLKQRLNVKRTLQYVQYYLETKKNTWLENVKNPEPDQESAKYLGFKHSPDTYSDFV